MSKDTTAGQRPWGPGIVEVRRIDVRLYGIRVKRALVSRLDKIRHCGDLVHTDRKSDLFCIRMDAAAHSSDDAVKRFKEIVAQAGLGPHFGVR